MIKYQISDDSHFNIFLFSQWNIMARYRYQYAYFIDCYRHFANICFFFCPIYISCVYSYTFHTSLGTLSGLGTRHTRCQFQWHSARRVCGGFFSCNIYYMYMQACVLRLTSRSYRRLPHYSTLHITFIIIPLNANTMPCHNSKMCRRCSRQLMPAGWQFDTLMAIANIDYLLLLLLTFCHSCVVHRNPFMQKYSFSRTGKKYLENISMEYFCAPKTTVSHQHQIIVFISKTPKMPWCMVQM